MAFPFPFFPSFFWDNSVKKRDNGHFKENHPLCGHFLHKTALRIRAELSGTSRKSASQVFCIIPPAVCKLLAAKAASAVEDAIHIRE